MDWTWFLATELQLFLLVPMLMWIYIKRRGLGLGLFTAMIVIGLLSGIVFPLVEGDYFTLTPSFTETNLKMVFKNPLLRMSVYFFGIICGIFYKNFKDVNFRTEQSELIMSEEVRHDGDNLFKKWIKSPKLAWLSSSLGFLVMVAIVLVPRTM